MGVNGWDRRWRALSKPLLQVARQRHARVGRLECVDQIPHVTDGLDKYVERWVCWVIRLGVCGVGVGASHNRAGSGL